MKAWNAIAGLLAVGLMGGAAAQNQRGDGVLRIPNGPRYVSNRVLVAFKDTVRLEARIDTVRQLGLFAAKGEQSPHFATLEIPAAKLQAGETVASTLAALKADPTVRYAEPVYYGYASALPNDPLMQPVWGLNNTGQVYRNGLKGTDDVDIDAPEAWDRTTGASNGSVRVAVIDTGVDWNHPDLLDNYGFVSGKPMGKDYVNNDDFAMDDHGHGTHVAGTIGAQGNNNLGISGVCQNVTLIGVKVLGADGKGSYDNFAKGVDFAISKGAKIINMSLGGPDFSQFFHDACARARDAGVLVVVAAGNEGVDNDDTPSYPANFRDTGLITVAASDSKDGEPAFTNIGANTVDLFAPGVDIYSTELGNRFDYKNGTSMATPHVAGAAALLRALEPGITRDALRQRILDMADPVPGFSGRCITGKRLNAYGMLGDRYENDNTWQTAKAVPAGGAVQEHTFHLADDTDWFKLTLSSAADVRITTNKPSWYQGPDGQTAIYLYEGNPDAGWFDQSNPGGYASLTRANETRLRKGTYYIQLFNPILAPLRAYSVSIDVSLAFEDTFEVDDTWQQAKTITPSSNEIRSIHLPGNDDWAKFVLTKPSEVVIETYQRTGGPNGATELYLYGDNPDGGWFDVSNTGGWSRIERSDDRLLAPGTYYLQVREQGHDGVLSLYGLNLDITAIPPPPAPSNLEAKAIDGRRIRLKWKDNSTGERGFRVWRESSDGTQTFEVDADTTQFIDIGLEPVHSYGYKVQTLGAGSLESGFSNKVDITTPVDRPAAPENLTTAFVKGFAELHWDDIAINETQYEISYKVNPNGGWSVLGTVPADSVGARATLPRGRDYTFRVRALGANDLNSDFSNEAVLSIPAPDLVGSWTQLTLKKKGKKYTMTAAIKIKNQGNEASPACNAGFYSSKDTKWDQQDPGIPVKVGSQYVPLQIPVKALKPGEEVSLGPVEISVSASTYKRLMKKKYLIGEVDWNRKVNEGDEENNYFVSQQLR